LRPAQRSPAAMLVAPARRSTLIARLRSVAITRARGRCGPGSGPRRRSRRGPSAAGSRSPTGRGSVPAAGQDRPVRSETGHGVGDLNRAAVAIQVAHGPVDDPGSWHSSGPASASHTCQHPMVQALPRWPAPQLPGASARRGCRVAARAARMRWVGAAPIGVQRGGGVIQRRCLGAGRRRRQG
jgi:hypothetical protein